MNQTNKDYSMTDREDKQNDLSNTNLSLSVWHWQDREDSKTPQRFTKHGWSGPKIKAPRIDVKERTSYEGYHMCHELWILEKDRERYMTDEKEIGVIK